MPTIDDALISLRQHFGFEGFRAGQSEVISAILEGKNAVVVMPTGSGKSLCYQLPAMMLKGATLVVSPLIALMKDQVDALRQAGVVHDIGKVAVPDSILLPDLGHYRLFPHSTSLQFLLPPGWPASH